jgi:dTDP-4-dehydrorhamnose 3,5-epimerase
MIKVDKTDLDGVLIIDPPTNFQDFRGSYIELYNERIYKKNGIKQNFIQDCNKKSVIIDKFKC